MAARGQQRLAAPTPEGPSSRSPTPTRPTPIWSNFYDPKFQARLLLTLSVPAIGFQIYIYIFLNRIISWLKRRKIQEKKPVRPPDPPKNCSHFELLPAHLSPRFLSAFLFLPEALFDTLFKTVSHPILLSKSPGLGLTFSPGRYLLTSFKVANLQFIASSLLKPHQLPKRGSFAASSWRPVNICGMNDIFTKNKK